MMKFTASKFIVLGLIISKVTASKRMVLEFNVLKFIALESGAFKFRSLGGLLFSAGGSCPRVLGLGAFVKWVVLDLYSTSLCSNHSDLALSAQDLHYYSYSLQLHTLQAWANEALLQASRSKVAFDNREPELQLTEMPLLNQSLLTSWYHHIRV